MLLCLSFPVFACVFLWSAVPACPGIVYFFVVDRGDAGGSGSSKVLCLMFVYILFDVSLCTGLILWLLDGLWFDGLCAE